jgi:hypothetical protein
MQMEMTRKVFDIGQTDKTIEVDLLSFSSATHKWLST